MSFHNFFLSVNRILINIFTKKGNEASKYLFPLAKHVKWFYLLLFRLFVDMQYFVFFNQISINNKCQIIR